MKMTFVLVAGLVLSCAVQAEVSVPGNNVAVVIRKPAVKTLAGFQFLCVPVNGFDITGTKGGAATVEIADFLPPANYADGTKLHLVNAEAEVSEAFVLQGGAWTSVEGYTGGTAFPGGQMFWIQDPAGTGANGSISIMGGGATMASAASTQADEASETIFCGESRDRADQDRPTEGTVAALKNDSSHAISLYAVLKQGAEETKPFRYGDEIQVVRDGYKNYRRYQYGKAKNQQEGWFLGMTRIGEGELTIAPGEAFYYYAYPQNN